MNPDLLIAHVTTYAMRRFPFIPWENAAPRVTP
jgi:hypothetical protein